MYTKREKSRTPLLERKAEIQSRTSDKPSNTWQLKHGLFSHSKQHSNEVHNLDINGNHIETKVDTKARSKSTSNYENINYENVREMHHRIPVCDQLTHDGSDRCETNIKDKTTTGPVTMKDIEIKQYDDKKRPPRLSLSTPSQEACPYEINHYDSETRPPRLSPANRKTNKFDYRNIKEKQNTVKIVNNGNGVTPQTIACNGKKERYSENEPNNSPRLRRHKNAVLDGHFTLKIGHEKKVCLTKV